jgi:hypothetical protein
MVSLAQRRSGQTHGRQRGVTRLRHPQVVGSIIGATGATVFVHGNRGALPEAWPTVALVAWVVVVLAFVWTVLVRPRQWPTPRPASSRAGFVYAASVLGMLVLIQAGGHIVAAVGRPELVPGVVVTAVGLHFVPFAATFGAPVFRLLGWSMTAIGAVGLTLGLMLGPVPVVAAAVLTGLVMLALIAVDATRIPRERPYPIARIHDQLGRAAE